MGVNSLPKTVPRHRRDCDLNPGLTTRLPSHQELARAQINPVASELSHDFRLNRPYTGTILKFKTSDGVHYSWR